MRLYIEKDPDSFLGYYVIAGCKCIAYKFTKRGALKVFNRYTNRIIKEVEL